jgi:hypothetical protein
LNDLLSLRDSNTTIVRTLTIYDIYRAADATADSWENDGGKSYLDQWNHHIAATSRSAGIPVARVYQAFNGDDGMGDPIARGYLGSVGPHPNDAGHQLMADLLHGLGYAPLK